MSTLYQGFVISGVRNTRTPLYQRLITLEVRCIRDSSYWGFDIARISWMGWGGESLFGDCYIREIFKIRYIRFNGVYEKSSETHRLRSSVWGLTAPQTPTLTL